MLTYKHLHEQGRYLSRKIPFDVITEKNGPFESVRFLHRYASGSSKYSHSRANLRYLDVSGEFTV